MSGCAHTDDWQVDVHIRRGQQVDACIWRDGKWMCAYRRLASGYVHIEGEGDSEWMCTYRRVVSRCTHTEGQQVDTYIWRGKQQVDAYTQKALQPGTMLEALMQAAVIAAPSCCSGSSHAARSYNDVAGSNDVAG